MRARCTGIQPRSWRRALGALAGDTRPRPQNQARHPRPRPPPQATWVYYQGRRWFAAGGVSGAGPDAHNLAFRFGSGAHSTLGLRSGDAWQAGGLSDGQLARFYGVPRLGEINNASSTDLQARKECLLAFLRPQSGPTRDGLPAMGGAANDVTPPSAPSGLAAVTRAGEGTVLTWGVASDDVAVLGYTLQVRAARPGG